MRKLLKAIFGTFLLFFLGGGLVLLVTGAGDGYVWDYHLRGVDGTAPDQAEGLADRALTPAAVIPHIADHYQKWVRWRGRIDLIRSTRAGTTGLALSSDGTGFGAVARTIPENLREGDEVVIVGRIENVIVRVRDPHGAALPTIVAVEVRRPTAEDEARSLLDAGSNLIDSARDALDR